MDNYKINDIDELLRGNRYPGRGIIVGKTPDSRFAVTAYFIMGRSANSRNRVLALKEGVLYTEPYDASKVEDPSLIIYPALRVFGNRLILTNGDQTDTIYEGLQKKQCFYDALESRSFEPDAPNFTPRISALVAFGEGDFTYYMSILKSMDENGGACGRFGFDYPACPGLGHLIHTYVSDGNPLPSFLGEPKRVAMLDDIDAFTDKLWNALDEDNKISLYVRYTNITDQSFTDRTVNKHQN